MKSDRNNVARKGRKAREKTFVEKNIFAQQPKKLLKFCEQLFKVLFINKQTNKFLDSNHAVSSCDR